MAKLCLFLRLDWFQISMAGRIATDARIDRAAKESLKGHGASSVVAFLSDNEGLSRRQAQRIVGRAYRLITQDLEEAAVDRRELTAQLVNTLQEAATAALERNHITGAVAACRELRELLGLGPQPPQPKPQTYSCS